MATERTIRLFLFFGLLCLQCGCGDPPPKEVRRPLDDTRFSRSDTIGDFARLEVPMSVTVSGYGLVGGLTQGGSRDCPGHIRAYLKRMVRGKAKSDINIDALIASEFTTVVYLEAVVPVAALKADEFDVKVLCLSGLAATVLNGGWLYESDLRLLGDDVSSPMVATVKGPVFVHEGLGSEAQPRKVGHILGGGRVTADPAIKLFLEAGDYQMASWVRNLIIRRFGQDTAVAVSADQIVLRVPLLYRRQRWRFFAMVEAMYLNQAPEVVKNRTMRLIGELASSQDRNKPEIALEAIGPACLTKIAALLQSSDEAVRLSAARCMTNLGSERGMQVLTTIATDPSSTRRREAIKAMGMAVPVEPVIGVLQVLLRDEDFDVVLEAYGLLARLSGATIDRTLVAGGFSMERIPHASHKTIVVTRKGRPRMTLFGAPIPFAPGRLFLSLDGSVMLDSRAEDGFVSLTRKHPTRPTVIGPLRCRAELGEMIRVFCREHLSPGAPGGGLGVSYADAIALIRQMCDKRCVDAELWAGPLPQ